jgi:hypothetical protein
MQFNCNAMHMVIYNSQLLFNNFDRGGGAAEVVLKIVRMCAQLEIVRQ